MASLLNALMTDAQKNAAVISAMPDSKSPCDFWRSFPIAGDTWAARPGMASGKIHFQPALATEHFPQHIQPWTSSSNP